MPLPKIVDGSQLSVHRKKESGNRELLAQHQSGAGFTLIEVMVTIAIIAIISTTTVIININRGKITRDAIRKQDINDIQKGMILYHSDRGHYPYQNILGVVNGFLFGCEYDPTKPETANAIIRMGEPWTCNDGGVVSNYMKIYPKDPKPWRGGFGEMGYIYTPLCFANPNCQVFEMVVCLENLDDPEAEEPGGPIILGSNYINCPPDRAPYRFKEL